MRLAAYSLPLSFYRRSPPTSQPLASVAVDKPAADQLLERAGAATRKLPSVRVGDASCRPRWCRTRDDADINYRLCPVAGAEEDLAVLQRGVLGRCGWNNVIVLEASNLQGARAVVAVRQRAFAAAAGGRARRAGPPY